MSAKNLAYEIEKTRKEQKMKVQDLAKLSGVSRVTLWKIRKQGFRGVKLETLEKIADALGVTLSKLT